jgi:hypothetical protein
MASPTTSPARSARSAPGGQPVSRNWLDRPACSSTWFGSGASLWSNRLPPKAVWRPDARVQHVNFQFGKQSGVHLQFASTARECLVMKQNNIFSIFLSHGGGRETFGACIVAQRNVEPGSVMPPGYIEPRKIVFHRRRVPHQACGMNWPQNWTLDLFFGRDIEQAITLRDIEAAAEQIGCVRARRNRTPVPPKPKDSVQAVVIKPQNDFSSFRTALPSAYQPQT